MSNNNPNQDICDMLIKLGEHERDVNGIIYKYHAYRKAAKALEAYGKRVESGAEAQKLSGIGPKIAQKIDDFLQNGNNEPKVEEKSKKKEKRDKKSSSKSTTTGDYLILEHYNKIYQMTKIDAMKYEIEGIRTISELKNHKTFLNEAQILCLEHFNDICEKIPRKEIKKFGKLLTKALNKLSNINLNIEICGSFRRKAECDSIDVLIIDLGVKSSSSEAGKLLKKTMKLVGKTLVAEDIIEKSLALEEDKFVGLSRLDKMSPYRRINLYFVAKDQYICALFYLTGSENFWNQIRLHCLNHGFILNKNFLCKIGLTCVTGLPIKLKNEEELFEYIDHPYIEPEHRN